MSGKCAKKQAKNSNSFFFFLLSFSFLLVFFKNSIIKKYTKNVHIMKILVGFGHIGQNPFSLCVSKWQLFKAQVPFLALMHS